MDGYTFEEWNFDNCFFPLLDATYILYLEGSPRLSQIKTQIFKNPPSKKVYLVRNLGYKKVTKPLIEQSTRADCSASHYMAAKHALKHNYENVLIMEDDFIFFEDIYDSTTIEEISDFIKNNDIRSYFLGVFPFFMFPATLDFKHFKILWGGGAHCIIHTSSGMKQFVKDFEADQSMTIMVDIYLAGKNAYAYHKCLCSQLVPETENRKTCWGKDAVGNFATWGIETLNLHKQANGWGINFLYILGKYWWLILICLGLIIYGVIKAVN